MNTNDININFDTYTSDHSLCKYTYKTEHAMCIHHYNNRPKMIKSKMCTMRFGKMYSLHRRSQHRNEKSHCVAQMFPKRKQIKQLQNLQLMELRIQTYMHSTSTVCVHVRNAQILVRNAQELYTYCHKMNTHIHADLT